jgi:hypothetical protein
MRERLSALDGKLVVESSRAGTLLTAMLPAPEMEPAQAPARLSAGAEPAEVVWTGLLKDRSGTA